MRVALFTDTFLPKVDGITTVICLLLDHLAERGVETIVFAPQQRAYRALQSDPRHHMRPVLPFPFYPDLSMALPDAAHVPRTACLRRRRWSISSTRRSSGWPPIMRCVRRTISGAWCRFIWIMAASGAYITKSGRSTPVSSSRPSTS